MRIGIAAMGADASAQVSMQCGRAPYLLIVEDGSLIESIKNPFSRGGGGAGVGVAKMLIDRGVKLVVCGQFGANMVEWLDDRGIERRELSGLSVREALDQI